MNARPPDKIADVLESHEIKAFTRASDLHGAASVVATWGIITFAFFVVANWPGVVSVAVALVLLGGRHLALAILMHEAAHRSLFRTRVLNDVIGEWLCAAPTWQHLAPYRRHHLAHHAHNGSPADPDLALVRAYPTTLRSLARKLSRDLLGVTGAKRVFALVLMDAGVLGYTASTDPKPLEQGGRTRVDRIGTFVRNFFPVALTNAALLAVLWAVGHPTLYLLWVASYLTIFSVFVRVRSIAEHACVPDPGHPFLATRTTRAGLLARLTVAPHHVNYHLEHHLLMTVPHHRLPELHRVLAARGALSASPVAHSYLQVLREATR